MYIYNSMNNIELNHVESRPIPLAILLRTVARISRARWFGFLRRVFMYQNGSRSDLGANPFNSKPWLVVELLVLLVQMIGITCTMAVSTRERPIWPARIWLASYNLGNFLSLPLLHWRWLHRRPNAIGSYDLEQQRATEESRSSYLMNKSRTFLELFFAIWFVMGNVWVFDSRYGNFDRTPKLYALCVVLLAWNAIGYSFPFLLFVLLCCCVPVINRVLGYNMNVASMDRGATDDQILRLPRWKFQTFEGTKGMLSTENSGCCICLAKYRDGEEVRQLPCLHLFHLGCVDNWLRISSCCPLCKQELQK